MRLGPEFDQRLVEAAVLAAIRIRGEQRAFHAERDGLYDIAESDAREVAHTGQDVYNSDSFITVPLIHGDRVIGVLNLSNKAAGLPFEPIDLKRATLAGALLAMTLGAAAADDRKAAWG